LPRPPAGLSPDEHVAVGWLVAGTCALATARLQHAGLPTPSLLVCAEDVMSGKPEPECYLKAAELLGVRPGDCVVIEDAPARIRAAQVGVVEVGAGEISLSW
jgi:mannitol-1-/sugar-/sorbitol-6-phosphatase